MYLKNLGTPMLSDDHWTFNISRNETVILFKITNNLFIESTQLKCNFTSLLKIYHADKNIKQNQLIIKSTKSSCR